MARAERTRTLVLLGVLVVVAAWAGLRYAGREGDDGSGPAAAEVVYQGRDVPRLELDLLTPPPEGEGTGQRNPFAFGAPPTPTPNLTPPPTLPPRPTAPPRPTPTPRYVVVDGQRLPPPPAFDRSFIGAFGPEHTIVAVFRKGEAVDVAIRGWVFDETYIVREIGYESVTIGFVGYPETEDVRVPLDSN